MNDKSQTSLSDLDRAADDRSRSLHIQGLVHQLDQGNTDIAGRQIPRFLIQYWDDSDVPSDVQRCLDSWSVVDDFGFKRLVFDARKAREFIAEHFDNAHVRAFDSCMHPAMRSDYFRLCYLMQHGGLYVDADDELREPEVLLSRMNAGVLLLQPLCYQLSTNSMVNPADFAGEVSDDFIFYVNNDPMFAPPVHPVVKAALNQATDRLLAANGTSKDIQWLTGPGNLSEVLVRHSLQLERAGMQPDFQFVHTWVQIAPGDWTLDYRNDARNWRLWIAEDPAR